MEVPVERLRDFDDRRIKLCFTISVRNDNKKQRFSYVKKPCHKGDFEHGACL
jgi:hypothetical protein